MARPPRVTIPALPHHIIQPGNDRQAIFFQGQIKTKAGRRLVGESRGRPRKIRPSSLENVL